MPHFWGAGWTYLFPRPSFHAPFALPWRMHFNPRKASSPFPNPPLPHTTHAHRKPQQRREKARQQTNNDKLFTAFFPKREGGGERPSPLPFFFPKRPLDVKRIKMNHLTFLSSGDGPPKQLPVPGINHSRMSQKKKKVSLSSRLLFHTHTFDTKS